MLSEEMVAVLDSVDELIIRREYEVARELMREHEKTFVDTTDWHRSAEYLLRKAELLLPDYKWEEATELLREVKEQYSQARMEAKEADLLLRRILACQGMILARQGKYGDAQRKFDQSLALGPKRDVRRAMIINSYASMLGEWGELEKSVGHYTQAISILESAGEEFELSRAYNNLADALYNLGDYEGTVDNARRCILLAEKTVNTRLLGFGYLTGGEALVKIGDLEEARKFYENSWRVLHGSQDDDYVEGCLYMLRGMVETGEAKYQEARESFEKAEGLLNPLGIPFYDAKIAFESAICYQRTRNHREARKRFENALDIFRQLRSKNKMKECKEHLAEIDAVLPK